jgi:Na+/melibiose symporter-like transporter
VDKVHLASGARAPVNPWRTGLAYGFLGLPLAFVALPLYVALPQYYARQWGVSLSVLGVILLATRLLDALTDPFIGLGLDQVFHRSVAWAWRIACGAGVVLMLGMVALWWPPAPVVQGGWLLLWLVAALTLTYLSYSVISIVHQAWAARWGGSEVQRARWVAWREGAALVGVLTASVLPSLVGQPISHMAMAGTLVLGLAGLFLSRHVMGSVAVTSDPKTMKGGFWMPWQAQGFAALMGVFVLNGVASALPATLLVFFVRDLLQAASWQALFLGTYFVAAAVALPAWMAAVRRLGLVTTWLLGMGLSVAAFCVVPWLGAGDIGPFWAVCLLSGAALGADLVVPGALLAGLVSRAGMQGAGESRFFAWWAFANKLNLALAAGLALPLLAWLGYQEGTNSPQGLRALALAYGAMPCLLKLIAAGFLWFSHRTPAPVLSLRSLKKESSS